MRYLTSLAFGESAVSSAIYSTFLIKYFETIPCASSAHAVDPLHPIIYGRIRPTTITITRAFSHSDLKGRPSHKIVNHADHVHQRLGPDVLCGDRPGYETRGRPGTSRGRGKPLSYDVSRVPLIRVRCATRDPYSRVCLCPSKPSHYKDASSASHRRR